MGGNHSLFCGSRDILTKVETESGPGRFASQIIKPHRIAVLCSTTTKKANISTSRSSSSSSPSDKKHNSQEFRQRQQNQAVKIALLPVTCPMCCETFNDSTHAACTLSCGHSICHQHTHEVSKCPICKTKFLEEDVARSISLGEVAVALVNTVTQNLQDEVETNGRCDNDVDDDNDDCNCCAPAPPTTKTNVTSTHVSECPICWETFNEKSCVPCTISTCGHSFCIKHVRQLKSCPICRDPFPEETKWEKSIALSNASIMLQSIQSSADS